MHEEIVKGSWSENPFAQFEKDNTPLRNRAVLFGGILAQFLLVMGETIHNAKMTPLKKNRQSNSTWGINPMWTFLTSYWWIIIFLNRSSRLTQAQKESKSESELDEMWWKMAGELVAKYYAAREEVEKDVEGGRQIYAEAMSEGSNFFVVDSGFPKPAERLFVVF